ncbi:MAG: hypothetical protein IT436_02900 [Phycisphaerales bacterium]|nr:hypothetical protein [Phycisphaerales bacterium]
MSVWPARPEAGEAGIEVWGCGPGDLVEAARPGPLSIRIDHRGPPEASAEVRREWASMCAANPRLHNGPVLSVVWFDAEQGSMLTRPDTYQRLAVQPRVRTGVRMLGVTALLIARDEAGREHALLGKRGGSVRVYGGRWELGPAGGLDSWHPGQQVIDPAAIVEQAADEVQEEAGLAVSGGSIIGLVRDEIACSYDVIVRIDAGDLRAARARPDGWEYTEVAWVSAAEAEGFMRERELIGPARAVLRALGWVGPGGIR